MTQLPMVALTRGSRRRMAAGALAVALLTPTPCLAFFQQTKLEGTVGTDLGGVWLSVQHLMPEFNIHYRKPLDGPPVPVEVGPVPADLEPVAGKKPIGLAIVTCINPGFCAENGLLVGDVILSVNSIPVPDVAAFEAVLANPAPTMRLTMRRPALKMSTTRLMKIKYVTEQTEVDGASVAQEKLEVRVLDLALPFADEIEKSRREHGLFQPSAAQMESLSKNWFDLEGSKPLLFVKGNHRFVAQSAFDEALASDKNLTDSKFALIMDLTGSPMRGGGGQVIDVYGIESVSAKAMDGSYVSVTIANAPFPINIEFKGRFAMTKLADWSDQDDKVQAARAAARKPPEDLNKFKTLPDVPAEAKPGSKAD